MRNDGGRTSIFAELNEIEREQFARCYINDLVFDLSVFVNGICVSLALSSSFSLSHSLCVCVLRILRCLPSIFMEKKRKKLHIIQFAFFLYECALFSTFN